MALQPTAHAAVLLAFNAPGVSLSRCPGGFRDADKPYSRTVVTTRTANLLVDEGVAVYDDPYCPRTLTLTPAGIQYGREATAAA
jgi:hypothetical protein